MTLTVRKGLSYSCSKEEDFMEYTVQKLSQLAGVSARTIRYYDERFTAYYDKEQPGTAKFLRDAVHIYLGIDNK